MRLSTPLLSLFCFLVPPTLIGLIYIYLYPVLQQCSFPVARRAEAACHFDGAAGSRPAVSAETAPFRLLALADPQLEGDTSLPDPSAAWLPSLSRLREDGVVRAVQGLVRRDVPDVLRGYRKKVDLWGNDLYLAHIYRMVSWWTQPTHTVVLGDLLGSQWIGDEEFARRSWRFWDVVFKGGVKVPREVADVSGRVEVLGRDEGWKRRVIAVAGNHDIGYAGDIDEHRIERFESAFGSVNWEVRFRLMNETQPLLSGFPNSVFATTPELRLIILNSMNLDEPAYNPELRQQSLDFLDSQLHTTNHPRNIGTIVLTHIPLHKKPGICIDAPCFSHFPADQGGSIREQNHLSPEISSHILDGLLSAEGSGTAIILNGHDHEGCDTYHHHRPTSPPPPLDSNAEEEKEKRGREWHASPFHHPAQIQTQAQPQHPRTNPSSHASPGLREITVRSMMGSYAGNAGLLSAWFDPETGGWRFEYESCMLGVQHLWWAAHVLGVVELGLGVVGLAALLVETWGGGGWRGKVKVA
ncbi:hypothetical protein B0A55_08365 [Friedmanniomyces simplex]|uniref:Calcineurin-like phosphoesterase domain-containing protein n=1 Tax=Friedmanniomyces simplex TaxID=329884 RepID=A0A4U0X8R2_9PEZI|nr:hypothetical protein B0A55_08365 [Friedmanniomyces simplex]